MSSNDEIEEELAAIEAILIDGLKVERRSEDNRPISVTFQVTTSQWRHLESFSWNDTSYFLN